MQKNSPVTMVAGLIAVVALGAAGVLFYLVSRNNPRPTPKPTVPVVLRLHGSNTIGSKLAPELVKAFLTQVQNGTGAAVVDRSPDECLATATLPGRGPVAVEIHAHGSKTAFADLLSGTCDLGMASRQINRDEAMALKGAGMGDFTSKESEHVVALDGLAIIVHRSNSVYTLTRDQIRRAFTGDAADWSSLGGAGGTITPYARDDKSGTYDTFKSLVLGDTGKLKEGTRRIEDSGALAEAVSKDPSGIGFVGLAYARDSPLPIKILSVKDPNTDPRQPTSFTVKTGEYLLSRHLYFYVPAQSKNDLVQSFISFVLSDAGQNVVRATQFIDKIAETQPQDKSSPVSSMPSDAPASYVALRKQVERLPIAFRFKTNSYELDNEAWADLRRLTRYLEKHPEQLARVVLVGFSDGVGNVTDNIRLSRDRASTVARKLNEEGISPSTNGFGPFCAVAGNESEEGRSKNRRVEVWIKRER